MRYNQLLSLDQSLEDGKYTPTIIGLHEIMSSITQTADIAREVYDVNMVAL